MSRCFPFPPPGYEKKARTDDVDLLRKEKHREKKHKKDKKDKEKKESKDKSKKDRKDGKHREKKDKKEKHRDKKKDREKDRDPVKDKISTSDEKRIPGKIENHVAEYKDSVDKRYTGQVGVYQSEKLSQNRHLAEENQHSALVELGRRTKDEARGIGNHLVEKIIESEQKKDEGMVGLVSKRTGISAEVKENSQDKRVDERRTGGQAVRGTPQVSGRTVVQNAVGMVKTEIEGLSRSLESNVDRKFDGKEKTKEFRGTSQVCGGTMVQNPIGMVKTKVDALSTPLESSVDRKIDGKEKTKEKDVDDKRGDKRKDREKKKEGKDKDKDKEKKKEAKAKEKNYSKNGEPDKEKKKEEKAKERNESKIAEPDKVKKSDKEDLIDSHFVVTTQLLKDSNKSGGADGTLKKRKDLQTNGVLHANDIRPSKLLRPSSSSHLLLVNGRTMEPCQTSTAYVSDRLGASNNVKVDNKDRKINGIIEAPSLSVSPAKMASTAAQAVPVVKASMRPAHPDSRYLSEVYFVPKVDEVPDDDDQDWLFGCGDTKSKKPKVESSGVEEIPEVWSEALRIESADVHALPYVIPY